MKTRYHLRAMYNGHPATLCRRVVTPPFGVMFWAPDGHPIEERILFDTDDEAVNVATSIVMFELRQGKNSLCVVRAEPVRAVDLLASAFVRHLVPALEDAMDTGKVADVEVVRILNEGVRPGECCSHDYLDANVVMGEAFEEVIGRPCDVSDALDADLWSAAWARALQPPARHPSADEARAIQDRLSAAVAP